MIGCYEVEGSRRRLEIFTGCDRRNIRHDAGEGCLDDRMRKLSCRFIALCYCLKVARILLHRAAGILVKICGNGAKLVFQEGQLLRGVPKVSTSRIEGCL